MYTFGGLNTLSEGKILGGRGEKLVKITKFIEETHLKGGRKKDLVEKTLGGRNKTRREKKHVLWRRKK